MGVIVCAESLHFYRQRSRPSQEEGSEEPGLSRLEEKILVRSAGSPVWPRPSVGLPGGPESAV